MSREFCRAAECAANQRCEVAELVKRIDSKGDENRVRGIVVFQMMIAGERECPKIESVTKQTAKVLQAIPQEALLR